MVKEFISAGSDEKKAVYGRMEEEVEKLKGSAARLYYGLYVLFDELHELHLKIGILAVVQPEIFMSDVVQQVIFKTIRYRERKRDYDFHRSTQVEQGEVAT